MSTSNDFSRDLVMDSTPDHSRCDDSEYGVSEPLHPTLTAPVVWIQDSAIVTHPGNGSPSPDLRRHHSVQHGPSPRTSPARGVFDLSPTHRGATDAEHEICPRMDNPDLDRTPDPVQSDPSNGLASMTFWGGSIYDPPVPVGPLPTIGGIASLTNTEFLSWPQGVYARDSFTSYPNSVSEERIFPQNSGPLIQPSYSPNCAARPVSTTLEHSKSNHFHLSRSGSQGPPLIINSNYDSLAQYSTFMSVPHDSDSTFSPKVQMTVVPQRSYARTGDREKHKSISFMVNGRLGIPARDAIEKIYAGLDGRDDQVFVDKPSVMMLRLEWPGYLPWSRKIRLNDWKRAPQRIKLDKLATEVAKCLERFILEAHTGKHPPDRECPDWRVGPDFIGIDRLVLVALDNVSRGSWQPRIGLLPM